MPPTWRAAPHAHAAPAPRRTRPCSARAACRPAVSLAVRRMACRLHRCPRTRTPPAARATRPLPLALTLLQRPSTRSFCTRTPSRCRTCRTTGGREQGTCWRCACCTHWWLHTGGWGVDGSPWLAGRQSRATTCAHARPIAATRPGAHPPGLHDKGEQAGGCCIAAAAVGAAARRPSPPPAACAKPAPLRPARPPPGEGPPDLGRPGVLAGLGHRGRADAPGLLRVQPHRPAPGCRRGARPHQAAAPARHVPLQGQVPEVARVGGQPRQAGGELLVPGAGRASKHARTHARRPAARPAGRPPPPLPRAPRTC